MYKFPNLSFLVDPAIYNIDLIKSPYSIISCVDKFDCEYVQNKNFDRVFFWPHAVERELGPGESKERPYDVVFLGSSYDPEGLRAAYQKKYPDQNWPLIDEYIEQCLIEPELTFWNAAVKVIKRTSSGVRPLTRQVLMNYIDNYIRGIDRLEMIKAVKDAHVHVFGGTCWRKETPIKGWAQTFANSPNVTVHPSIPFGESMEILKKSKICLNSMPFFKNGTHERIFTGLACGCLPITTENIWVKDNFTEGEELLLYRPRHWNEINDKVNYYLSNENERQRIVAQGREKVMREHTWDNRVEQLLEIMPSMLQKMPK